MVYRSKEFSSNHQLPEHEKWANEYMQEQLLRQPNGDLQRVAKHMTEELTDPDVAATEFMQFVKKLSTGEAAIEGNQVYSIYLHNFHATLVIYMYMLLYIFQLGDRKIF